MRDQLLAALYTAATQDVRYYLNCVCVDATSVETRLYTTDGIVLAAQRADAKGDNEIDGLVRVLVPVSALAGVKKNRLSDHVTVACLDGVWSIIDDAVTIAFTPTEGSFPDITRVIPRRCSGERADFDQTFVARFVKAAAALGVKGIDAVKISTSGASSALVEIAGRADYVGVIMPLRAAVYPAPCDTPPAWALSLLSIEEDLA